MKKRFPKPMPPTAKDTRGIMLAKSAKQPDLVIPSKALKKPLAKKQPKKKLVTQQQGRRTLTTSK